MFYASLFSSLLPMLAPILRLSEGNDARIDCRTKVSWIVARDTTKKGRKKTLEVE